MEAYRAQNWQEAASRLGEMLTHFPDDGPTQIFLDRVLEFMRERARGGLGRGLCDEDEVGET